LMILMTHRGQPWLSDEDVPNPEPRHVTPDFFLEMVQSSGRQLSDIALTFPIS
jgi:hypothetical protein